MKEKAKQVALAAVPVIVGLAVIVIVRTRANEERTLARHLLERSSEQDIIVLVSSDFAKMDDLPGRKVILSDAVHWDDVMGYDVAWVVGPAWLEVPLLGEVTVQDVGPYRVHRIDLSTQGPEGQGYSLMRHLGEASVHRMGNRIEPCPRRAGVFACPGEAWFSVDVRRVPMNATPFECIYAHPKTEGALTIVFPSTPGGSILHLRGGIDDDGVYYPHGASVELSVEAHGAEVARTSFENVPGIQERVLDLEPPVRGPAALVVKITTRNQDTRHFCFTGWLEPTSGGEDDRAMDNM